MKKKKSSTVILDFLPLSSLSIFAVLFYVPYMLRQFISLALLVSKDKPSLNLHIKHNAVNSSFLIPKRNFSLTALRSESAAATTVESDLAYTSCRCV